ncbi:MAG: phage holin family protein [Sandaracinus sp.]
MGILVSWLILTFSFVVASKLIDGFQLKGGLGNQLMVAALFAILELVLGHALFVAIGIGTLGLGFLFAFVTRLFVGAILLKFTDALTDKLKVKSLGTAFVASLVMSITATLTEGVLHVIGL